MSKPVLTTVSVLMVLLVGLVQRDGTPIDITENARIFGMEVRVTVKVEVNPTHRWRDREPGLVCVAGPAMEDGRRR